MKRNALIPTILAAVLMLISCSEDTGLPPSSLVGSDVQPENWNTAIKLVDDPVLSNSHRNGQDLTLRVENLSDTTILFPDDFGIKIISKNGPDWQIIPNNFYYTFPKTLPTKESYPLGLLVSALPYLSNLPSPISIRVIIVGYAENNDKNPFGAYIDIALNP